MNFPAPCHIKRSTLPLVPLAREIILETEECQLAQP